MVNLASTFEKVLNELSSMRKAKEDEGSGSPEEIEKAIQDSLI